MKNLIVKLAFLAAMPACAQVPVCTEGCTITAISAPAVFQFGAGSTWNKITNPKLPLVIDCAVACPQLGGDPLPGVVKSIQAIQQATAYTVTLSNGTKKTIPALSTTYAITCTGTGSVTNSTMTITNSTCTAVKQ